MRAALTLFILLIALSGCKVSNFAGSDPGQRKSASAEVASTGVEESTDEVIALEPVSVGGAFLGCFADPQIPSELLKDPSIDGMAVGCQAFEDANYSRVLGRGSLIVDSAELPLADSQQILPVQTMESHPRWAWLIKVPASALGASLYLNIRARSDSNPVRLKVELLDILPAAVAGQLQALTSGTYHLRVKGSRTCLHANPVWDWDNVNQKPITDTLRTKACPESLRFQFTRLGAGLRVHVVNPAPHSCDPQYFAVEHCNSSCVDLENFGLGNRFSMWACTLSEEAQSFRVLTGAKGSARLQVNGRFMNLIDQSILPGLDAATEMEIIPLAP